MVTGFNIPNNTVRSIVNGASDQSKQYHSIVFVLSATEYKNTWDDWRLVPSSRPLVEPAPVNTSYGELLGGDGLIDFTTSLTGSPTYGNRSGSWDFIVVNSYQITGVGAQATWASRFSSVLNFLHGKYFERIILLDDPTNFYSGRLAVDEWHSGKGNSTIRINYNLDPYKRQVTSTGTRKF